MRRSSLLIHRLYRWYRTRFGPEASLSYSAQRAAQDRLWRSGPLRGTLIDPADAGGVPAEWVLAPGVVPEGDLLYLHGGAYTHGSTEGRRGFCSRVSRAGEVRVLDVGYRLAPEHPHPAAVEDAVAAYRWLLADGAVPDRVVIGGDSAGGGLVLSALVALREQGLPLPAAAVLLSPWADLTLSGSSITAHAGADPVLDAAGLREAAGRYLGDTPASDPGPSPLFADLSGLPLLLVQVGTTEMLYDDSVRLATAARAAGVQVVLDEWPEAPHGFQTLAPLLPEARSAIHQIGVFVARALAD